MAEVLHGKATGDNLAVSANKTQVYGLVGNDTLTSDGKSNVLLIGGSGNDRLIMTGGDGTLSGGAGADIFEFNYSVDQKISAVIEDVDPSNDKIVVNFAGDSAPKLSSVASGNDVVWTDGDGYFNLTLKSSSDASDYFDGTASDEVWEVFRLTNNEREKQGLSWLTLSQGLTDGAAIRSTEIVEVNSHTRPDGTDCFTAVKKSYTSEGENIAAGYASASEVVTGWMNSTGHRENILRSNFTKLGVGHTSVSSDDYKDYWAQMFGGNLISPDTLSTAELLSAKIEVATVSAQATDTTPADTTPADTTPADTTPADTTPANPKLITLTEGNDTIRNLGTYTHTDSTGKSSVTIRGGSVQIDGGTGNDSISNGGDNATLYGGDGNDRISNYGDNTTVYGGAGNDVVLVGGTKVAFFGEVGDDRFFGDNLSDLITTVDSGNGNDTVEVAGQNLLIYGGDGKDSIDVIGGINGSTGKLYVGHITLDAGAGDDIATIGASFGIDDYYSSILGGSGNDSLEVNGNYVTVNGGSGNDSLLVEGSHALIYGEDGNDTLRFNGTDLTVTGGKGNDFIEGWGMILSYGTDDFSEIARDDVTYQYVSGDGNDTIDGFNEKNTLQISGGSYTTQTSDNDVIVKVGDGSITLKDAKGLTLNIKGTLDTTKGGSSSTSTTTGGGSSSTTKGGGSSTSGGSSSSTTKGGGSSTSGGGSSSTTKGGGSSTSTTTGGSSSSTTKGGSSSTSTTKSGSSSSSTVWDKLFSTSTSTSSTSTTRSGVYTSTGTSSTSTTRSGVYTSSSTSSTSTTRSGVYTSSSTSSTSTTRSGVYTSSGTSSTSTTRSTSTGTSSTSTTRGGGSTSTTNQNVYTGGDKIISNYLGQPITIGAYTGATFDDNGNFFVGSPTGTLVIQNAADKIVDLRDGAGNAFIKAYTPSTAGVIDGRGLVGYEIIQGSANGTDIIFAGDGGSQLWGGAGLDADALVGGNGADIFSGGRFQGSDNIFNASSADAVNLTDATLSDIVAATEVNGNISIGFNTGNVINIQSTELLSAAINLADGSSLRYNHATKAWQGA